MWPSSGEGLGESRETAGIHWGLFFYFTFMLVQGNCSWAMKWNAEISTEYFVCYVPSAGNLSSRVVLLFHGPQEQHLQSESFCPLLQFLLAITQLSCVAFQESRLTPARINDKIPTAEAIEPMGQMDICYQNIRKALTAIKSYMKYLL